jgi:hypothetical protein
MDKAGPPSPSAIALGVALTAVLPITLLLTKWIGSPLFTALNRHAPPATKWLDTIGRRLQSLLYQNQRAHQNVGGSY